MPRFLPFLLLLLQLPAAAEVVVDVDGFGKGLGGWKARKGQAAEYQISDAAYRTYRPEVSPSPDGGIYVSVRIDHRRGFFASDDHASLELSFAADGTLVSAQSSLALQGRTITSELIKGGSSAATNVAAPGIDHAVKVGSDLVADLSAKILREKIIEPGRVSFPAAIRHNYNLLYLAVKPKAAPANATAAETANAQPPVASSTAPAAAGPNAPVPAPASAAASAGPSLPVPPPPSPPASGPTPPAPTPTAPAGPSLPAPPPAPTPAPPAVPPPPGSPVPTPAPRGADTSASAATTTGPKPIPLPEIKPYDPGRAAATPLPPPKEKSLLLEHGDEVLKMARKYVLEDKP
jgi:hypothetical protein